MEEVEKEFTHIASLIGDKARSAMLWNLLDGRAYTARELSICANISPQSASNHLTKLINARILAVTKQGRHRYYVFKNPETARVIECMASLISENKERPGKIQQGGFSYARTCYDHLAGKLGVELTDALVNKGIIEVLKNEYAVTPYGKDWLLEIDIDVNKLRLQKRLFAPRCLDWSERRYHLAGALGSSILQIALKMDWVRRTKNSREIVITPKGKLALNDRLNLEI